MDMKKLIIVIFLLLIPSVAFSTNYYVRAGASGTCTTSWSNACAALSSAVSAAGTGGDTIYVANGAYSSVTINKSNLTIKKATATDHGSDTSWNASYANQATFSGTMTITASTVTIDGAYRNENAWNNETAYGFYLTSSSDGFIINADYTTIKYVALNPGNAADDAFYIGVSSGGQYVTISHTYSFNVGRCNVLGRGISNGLYEYNFFGDAGVGTSASTHGEAFSVYNGTVNYNTIRYNIFKDWGGGGVTGALMFGDSNYTFVYGNVFKASDNFACNGVVGSWTGYTSTNWRIYNNTFADILDGNCGAVVLGSGFGTTTGSISRNNVFYNNNGETIQSGTVSHTATDGTNIGTDAQTNLTDIFVSRAGGDYRLTAATNAGYTLTNETVNGRLHTYNTDMLGNIRGADGLWDRGAFEYTGVVPPPPPVRIPLPPSGLSIQ